MIAEVTNKFHTTYVIGVTEDEAWELLHHLETADEHTNTGDAVMIKLREWLGDDGLDDGADA